MKQFLKFAAILCLASPSFAEEIQLTGEYIVPVPRDELKEFASYPIENYTINLKGEGEGPNVMEFTLPKDLTGRDLKVRLKQVQNTPGDLKIFQGRKGTSTCMSNWKNLQCVVDFKNLNIDPAQVNSYLESKFAGSELMHKKELSARFGLEPIGFFTLRDPNITDDRCQWIEDQFICKK